MDAPVYGVHVNYPESAYYADPCPVPSLTQSIAKTIIYQSEKHAWMQHPRLGGVPMTPTKAMNVGTICHALMLGQPLPEIDLIPYDNYKTKDAQTLKRLALECGKIPLTQVEWGEQSTLRGAAEALRDKLRRLGVEFKREDCEVAFFWKIDGVHCRARMDNLQGYHAIDLKFCDSANPTQIDRNIQNLGYQIQDAAYTEAIRECIPEAHGRETFTLLYCEIEEPFCITPARMSEQKQAVGRAQWERARSQWKRCLETDVWHEYVDFGQCHIIEAKPWEVARELDNGYQDV